MMVLFKLVFIVSILLLVGPILITLLMSFDSREYMGPFPPPSLSLRWYQNFFSSRLFMGSARNSLVIGTTAASLSTVIGLLAAFSLSRSSFRGRGALEALIVSPVIVPGVIIGFSILLFFSSIGYYGGWSRLILAHTLIALPFAVRILYASLQGIPYNLTEAALNLGANERQSFFDITLPLVRSGVISSFLFSLALSFDEVAVSIFLVDPQTTTLPISLLSNMRNQFDLTIAAASGILIAFTLVVLVIADRLVGLDRMVGQSVHEGKS
jgi:putative spermidine/putrescine transport system permease protein